VGAEQPAGTGGALRDAGPLKDSCKQSSLQPRTALGQQFVKTSVTTDDANR
jgi:hypothetical protein